MDHQIRAWWVARKLPSIIRQIPIGVVVVSVTGKIVYANPYVLEATGNTDKELLGFQIDTLRYEPFGTLTANLYQSISLGEPWQGETQIREKSGGTFHVLESIYPLRESDGSMTQFVHFLQDISGQKLSEAIFRLAFYDTLTGLPNRNLFNDRLSHALTNAQRNQTGFAVMYIDVDNFKQVNDTLGHEAGRYRVAGNCFPSQQTFKGVGHAGPSRWGRVHCDPREYERTRHHRENRSKAAGGLRSFSVHPSARTIGERQYRYQLLPQ